MVVSLVGLTCCVLVVFVVWAGFMCLLVGRRRLRGHEVLQEWIGVLLLTLIGALVLWLVFEQFRTVHKLLVTGTVLTWLAIAVIYGQSLRSGPLLVELGYSSRDRVFLGVGFLFTVLSRVLLLEEQAHPLAERFWTFLYLQYLSLGVLFITAGIHGLQLRTRGLFSCGGLVRWNRVRTYRWSGRWCNRLELVVDDQHRDAIRLVVPREQIERVDAQLARELAGEGADQV